MAGAFTEFIVESPAFAWLKSTDGREAIYHLPGESGMRW